MTKQSFSIEESLKNKHKQKTNQQRTETKTTNPGKENIKPHEIFRRSYSDLGWHGLSEEGAPGKFRVAFFSGSGSVRVSGADFFRGRSLGTDRNSGASVDRGVDGALEGALRTEEGSRGMLEIEIAGGKTPIFLLVAS